MERFGGKLGKIGLRVGPAPDDLRIEWNRQMRTDRDRMIS